VLAIDWSSDPGINSRKPPPPPSFLGLAVVAYDDENIIGEVLDSVRSERRLSHHHEFHFVDENHAVCMAFFTALAKTSIVAALAVVDKHRASTSRSWMLGSGDDLIHQLMLLCTESMPRDVVEEQVVLVDGNKGSKPFCTRTRKLLAEGFRASGRDYRIDRVRPAESHRTAGVQAADMLSGAARHAQMHNSLVYLNLVKKKVVANIILP